MTESDSPNETEPVLSPLEARIVGSLMEKEMATPEHYPLTMASLVAACCQKSNRNPVMELETATVEKALGILRREKKWVTLVHEAGARVPKFRHELASLFELSAVERAVLAELLLRGPQTVAELRARVPRMTPVPEEAPGEGPVEGALDSLREVRGLRMVMELPKQPGRREIRFAEVLTGKPADEPRVRNAVVIEAPTSSEEKRIGELEARVGELESAVESMRRELAEFRASFE